MALALCVLECRLVNIVSHIGTDKILINAHTSIIKSYPQLVKICYKVFLC